MPAGKPSRLSKRAFVALIVFRLNVYYLSSINEDNTVVLTASEIHRSTYSDQHIVVWRLLGHHYDFIYQLPTMHYRIYFQEMVLTVQTSCLQLAANANLRVMNLFCLHDTLKNSFEISFEVHCPLVERAS